MDYIHSGLDGSTSPRPQIHKEVIKLALAIRNTSEEAHEPQADPSVVLDEHAIHIVRPTSFPAPLAAARLAGLAAHQLVPAMTRYLDIGSEAFEGTRTSAAVRFLEAQVGELTQTVTCSLIETLTEGRELNRQELDRTLNDFGHKLTSTIARYLDGNSQTSIPFVVRQQVAEAGQKILRDVSSIVGEGDGGALGKVKGQIVHEIQESTTRILTQMASREALLTKSNLSGAPFEVALTEAVCILLRPSNDMVERCGDKQIGGRRTSGDVLVTLNPSFTGGETVRLVLEAKKRGDRAARFTNEGITKALRDARTARGAAAAVFVADSVDVLPGDYFTVYDPENANDLGLAAALYLARIHALASVKATKREGLDLAAAQAIVQRIRTSMERLGMVEGEHIKAAAAIKKAGAHCEDLRGDVIAQLRILDDMLMKTAP
jgi:hypothetical protein